MADSPIRWPHFFVLERKRKKAAHQDGSSVEAKPASVESEEEMAHYWKGRVFGLRHFDSPTFIDRQNAYDAMERNYLRLKHIHFHEKNKALELATDWRRYVEALKDLQEARVRLDLDMGDDALDTFGERIKEPQVAKDVIEAKFKSLMKGDWVEVPPDYGQRMESMAAPSEEERAEYGGDDWKHYYRADGNLMRLEDERRKEKE